MKCCPTRYTRLIAPLLGKCKTVELTYFVTEKCNMNCPHCFNQLKNTGTTGNELSVQEIDRFSKTLGPMMRLLLSGGEPFLREDLVDLCKTFIRNTDLLHLTIPTNASLPDKIYADTENIASSAPHTFIEIKISVDQIGAERDAFTRYPGGIEKMVETVQQLKRLQQKYKNIGLSAITTYVPENQDSFDSICSFVRETLEIDHHSVGLVRSFDEYSPDIDEERFFERYLEFFDNEKKRSGLSMPFYNIIRKLVLYRTYLDVMYRRGTMEYLPCLAGKTRAVMDPCGNVYPCEIKGYPTGDTLSSDWLIGNIRDSEYDFQELWHSNHAKKIRKRIKDTQCMCNHGCDMNMNILLNPRILIKALTMSEEKMRKSILGK